MKKKGSSFILVFLFLLGIAVMLYPTITNWWNSRAQSQAIVDYEEAVAEMSQEDYDTELAKAEAYNRALSKLSFPLIDYDQVDDYPDVLNVTGDGIMGYIEIPTIDVRLPIYHGTSESIMSVAVGHLEGSSLPVGGEGTHCVLSGHRGLPTSKLFTNLDKVKEGDIFTITVLNRLLTYEVDQILVVKPEETEALQMEDGKDYCTLVTCTPYAVNTHRLLVRGHRIENAKVIEAEAELYEINPVWLFVIAALSLLFIVLRTKKREERA